MIEKVRIKDIKVGPRQRTDIGKTELLELKDSLMKFGQLHPIIIDADNRLISGLRRLLAAGLAGWTEVSCVRCGQLTEAERKLIELEENIRRLDLPWQDRAKAIAEIHRLKKAEDPGWNTVKTAALVGLTPRMVQYYLDIMESSETYPEVLKADTSKGAIQSLQAKRALEKRRAEIASRKQYGETSYEVLTGDALEILPLMDDESVDAIITDPGDAAAMEAIIPELYRVLRPNSWLVIFYSIRRLEWLRSALESVGFKVNDTPCCWVKPNKTKQNKDFDPTYNLVMAYQMFLLGRKGNAVLTRKGRNNIFIYDEVHSAQMPVELCEELVSLFSLGGNLILDPFCGFGSVGVGALRQRRNFLGIEINPDHATQAEHRLQEELK